MEEVSMDLIENLNKSGGCQHILVVKDALTDFVLLFPLKSKTATEVARVCKYGLFQQYNIKRLHTDNGSCFRQVEFLGLMAELKIEVINTSVHKPTARGFIEKEVHIVKTIFKKILASGSNKTLNWEDLPLLVSILLNHTVSLRTGFKPAVLMYGETQMANCFLDTEEMVPVHHSLRTNKAQLIRTSANVQRIIETAKETITAKRQHEHDTNNENRIIKPFKKRRHCVLIRQVICTGGTSPVKDKIFFQSSCCNRSVLYDPAGTTISR
jgi:transposase InsO family protein